MLIFFIILKISCSLLDKDTKLKANHNLGIKQRSD